MILDWDWLLVKNKFLIENFIYSYYFVDEDKEQSYPINWMDIEIKSFWDVGSAPNPYGIDYGNLAPYMNGEKMTYSVA